MLLWLSSKSFKSTRLADIRLDNTIEERSHRENAKTIISLWAPFVVNGAFRNIEIDTEMFFVLSLSTFVDYFWPVSWFECGVHRAHAAYHRRIGVSLNFH